MPDALHFKDNLSAFEYACEFSKQELVVGANAIGMVFSSFIEKSGEQVLLVQLAGKEKTFASAVVANPKLKISTGDLVAFRLQAIKPELPAPFDKIGVVGAKVARELSLETGWRLINNFDSNKKPSFAEKVRSFFNKS